MGGCRVLRDLDEWLNSINPNLGKKKRPGLKELWKSGDLREKLAAVNAKISSIRTRWQVRGLLRFRRRTLLTTTMTRCDFKSAHSYRRTWSLADWTLYTPKRLLRPNSSNRYPPCSNRYSACSSRARSANGLVVSQCIHKSNRLASIARQQGWVTTRTCRYILMHTILRSWPIQLHPWSLSPYCPLTLLSHMIVSNFA